MLLDLASLVGQSGQPKVLRRHRPLIQCVEIVCAYIAFGVLYFVEVSSSFALLIIYLSTLLDEHCVTFCKNQVDIEFPEDLVPKEANAIGESLQIKIEELVE